jgi:hypothetical protein
MITWTEMIEMTGATELSSVASATQSAILTQVAFQLDEDTWGDLYEAGCAWLAAHIATVSRRKGTGGAVQSESVGSVSRTYAVSTASYSTSYGAEYERLAGMVPEIRFGVSS